MRSRFESGRTRLLAAPAAALFALMPVLASAAPAPAPLDAKHRNEIVEGLASEVLRHYVEADTAKMIVAGVRARLRAGAYDTLTTPFNFAEAVTRDLRRVNGDRHLSLRYAPDGGGGAGQPVLVRRMAPGGPGGGDAGGPGERRVVIGGPGGAPSGNPPPPGGGGGEPMIVRRASVSPGDSSAFANGPFGREAREKNFGLGRLEILPGNIGYLEITGFLEAPGMEDVLVSALRFLERTDAIIFDVRRNGGGSGNMTHLIYSHFMPAEPVQTIRVKSREEGMSRVEETFREVPGPRRPDVPLYVLTSRNTGSAAEEFSFVLKNLGRATVVGDRTAGAGHMVAMYDLPDGFVAGVSITRVSDPRTGREWEGIGVQPDVRVAPEHALAVAHATALRALAAKGDADSRTKREMLAEWIEARDHATGIDAARAAAIAGRYDGERSVRVEGGRLTFRRNEGQPDELVPIGGDRFSYNGEARISFVPGSPSPSMIVERADGTRSTYPRVGGAD
jgi:hypothetical protein